MLYYLSVNYYYIYKCRLSGYSIDFNGPIIDYSFKLMTHHYVQSCFCAFPLFQHYHSSWLLACSRRNFLYPIHFVFAHTLFSRQERVGEPVTTVDTHKVIPPLLRLISRSFESTVHCCIAPTLYFFTASPKVRVLGLQLILAATT